MTKYDKGAYECEVTGKRFHTEIGLKVHQRGLKE